MSNPKYNYRKLVFKWWFVGWEMFSLGFHIDFFSPNIEIHLPFGFIRIGFEKHYRQEMTFLETFVCDLGKSVNDIDKRLQGVEKWISCKRVDEAINK